MHPNAPISSPSCPSQEQQTEALQVEKPASYVCQMCVNVEAEKAGRCPLCGMPLVPNPLAQRNEPECCGDSGEAEVKDLWWRVRWSAAMAAPVVLLSSGAKLPVLHHIPNEAAAWMQLVWATPVVFWVGQPLLVRGLRSLLTLRPNMFTLIGLGMLVAWGYSAIAVLAPHLLGQQAAHGDVVLHFESAAIITVIVLLGQLLELRARQAAGAASRSMLGLLPARALRVQGEMESEVPLADVQPGDILSIKAGARIPVDGVVVKGSSSVDESMLAGMTLLREKAVDATVFGGTLNGSGDFLMRAEHVGASMRLRQIEDAMQRAQASRAPAQRFADHVASWLVPCVIGVASLTFLLWWKFGPQPSLAFAVIHAVAVLIIASPSAFGLSVPMAIAAGLGRGAQLGLLIKNAVTLERLRQADLVMLDQEGPLTEGKPTVAEIVPLPGLSARDLLACAAAVEAMSEHPVATAIVSAAKERSIPLAAVTDFQEIAGGGVIGNIGANEVFVGQASFLRRNGVFLDAECHTRSAQLQAEGCTVVMVVLDHKPLGLIAVRDKVKESAPQAIAALRALGLKLQMLTGDAAATAQRVATELGIDEVAAEVPEKERLLQVYQARGKERQVTFVGDGIKDASALAAADVGIAMGMSTEGMPASASVTLVHGELRALPQVFSLSREVQKIVRQNLGFAICYNSLAIPLAAGILYPFTGWWLSPIAASVAMSLSSVLVILNSLRLRRFR